MMKKLGTKLSSKSSHSQQSTGSSIADSIFSSRSSHKSTYGPNAIPLFERQEIPPHILLELRLACAAIVKETGPSGAELEAILNQADPLEQYKKEEQHRKDIEKIRIQASRTHASAFPPVRGARERDRLSKSNLDSLNISSASLVSPQPVPKPTTHKPLIPFVPKQPQEVVELESPVLQRTLSRKPVPQREERTPKARPQHEPQPPPKPVADDRHNNIHGRTGASSNSTTRSNTTFDHHVSTSQTSFAQTPADNKRSSLQQHHPLRSSSKNQPTRPPRHDEHGALLPETDFFSPNPDYEVPSLYYAKVPANSQGPSRSRSRAGSIKDSIFGGIRDYMQPRPSMERMSRTQSRQSRSTSRAPSETPSRSSSMTRSSREWMRNAASSLRRKGSIGSIRSQRGETDDDRGRKGNRGPDLNRQLPPLPGLDSYKEPKKHIAQLLSRSKFSSKSVTENTSRDLLSPAQKVQAVPYMADQPAISSQTITSQSKMSPESVSSKQFPRIPFAEGGVEERAASPRQWSATRQRKASQDLLDKNQEDELRRVVREKIMQGALSTDALDIEHDRNNSLQRSKTVKQNSWELEQMEAGYIPTGRRKQSHQRSGSVTDGPKKGFKGRFSRFMGHGRDQNSVIASY